ncbi:Nn.00g059150.m01.CDS01 [Neocucurbitaria sp. VM-36]
MAARKTKKTVHFAPDTTFEESRRPAHQYRRFHPHYVPGKYICPSGEWADTSFMNDFKYRLVHLNTHSILAVRDAKQLAALRLCFEAQMKARVELAPGTNTQMKDHPFRHEILDFLVDTLCGPGTHAFHTFNQDMLHSDALVVYKDAEGKFQDIQLVRDTYQDEQASKFLVELEESRPAKNTGEHGKVVLRRVRVA